MSDGPRIGSICSGMGGLCELGLAPYIGGRVVWHADHEPPSKKNPRPKQSASKVLAHHWPNTPNLGDLSVVDWSTVEPVDWLTGGYPCQPFSVAGGRKGTEDERHVWPHVVTAISHLRPPRVFFENVAGHVSLGLDAVLGDLATLGYDAVWGVVPAAAAGAPHLRERLFILGWDRHVAHSPRDGRHEGWPESARFIGGSDAAIGCGPVASDTAGAGLQGRGGVHRPTGEVSPAAHGEGPGPVGHPNGVAGSSTPALRRGSDPLVGSPTEQRTVGPGGDPVPHPESQRRSGGGLPDDTAPAHGQPGNQGDSGTVDWRSYGPAIARWERILGRPAPPPVETTEKGVRVLSPRLTEWVMGVPEGHVTDVPSLSRAEQLHVLGNGCVPAAVQLALSMLLPLLDDQTGAGG